MKTTSSSVVMTGGTLILQTLHSQPQLSAFLVHHRTGRLRRRPKLALNPFLSIGTCDVVQESIKQLGVLIVLHPLVVGLHTCLQFREYSL